MPHQPVIFINLPASNLAASEAFYAALGFTKNPKMCSDDTTTMVFSKSIIVILMEHARFKGFISENKEIGTGRSSTQFIPCLSVEKREDVDRLIDAAVAKGGSKDPTTLPEMGDGFCRSIEDPDGHLWEVGFMGSMDLGLE